MERCSKPLRCYVSPTATSGDAKIESVWCGVPGRNSSWLRSPNKSTFQVMSGHLTSAMRFWLLKKLKHWQEGAGVAGPPRSCQIEQLQFDRQWAFFLRLQYGWKFIRWSAAQDGFIDIDKVGYSVDRVSVPDVLTALLTSAGLTLDLALQAASLHFTFKLQSRHLERIVKVCDEQKVPHVLLGSRWLERAKEERKKTWW